MRIEKPDVITRSVMSTLCLDHLHHEETLLKAALPVVADIRNAFGKVGLDAFAAALGGHRDLVKLMDDVQQRRESFSEAMRKHLGMPGGIFTISAVISRLAHETEKAEVAQAAERVRSLAHELTVANFVVSVHVRIHLDAYRRILRDLTNTTAGSGRYGPAGRAESLDYRPLLQIRG